MSARPQSNLVDLANLLGLGARRSSEMDALFTWIAEQERGLPDPAQLPLAQARLRFSAQGKRAEPDRSASAAVEPISVPSLDHAREIACNLITPPNARPGGLLYLHGGGWAFGDLDSHAGFARVLANAVERRVLYVDYRLAPEHPFPAGLDDVVAAWRFLVGGREDDARFQGPLGAAGDSAGANLAFAAMLREREADRPVPNCAMLFYGVYDDDIDSPSYLRFGERHGLTRAGMAKFWDLYAPQANSGQTRANPLLTPVCASDAALAGLPPLYLNAAGLDPLLCDTVKLIERLAKAAGAFEFTIHEGVHHGFMQHTARLAEARRAVALAADFFRRYTNV